MVKKQNYNNLGAQGKFVDDDDELDVLIHEMESQRTSKRSRKTPSRQQSERAGPAREEEEGSQEEEDDEEEEEEQEEEQDAGTVKSKQKSKSKSKKEEDADDDEDEQFKAHSDEGSDGEHSDAQNSDDGLAHG